MKHLNLILIFAFVAFGLNAQEARNVSNGTVYLKDKASDHWYIGIGGGTNIFTTKAESDANGSFGDRLGWMGQLEVGRWNSPVWGARAVIDAGLIEHIANLPAYGPGKVNQNWVGGHLDLMWNMTNAVSTYNPDRVWNFIPYFGVGYMNGLEDWKKVSANNNFFKNQNQSLTWNAGLINNFQLSKNVALFVELGWRIMQGTFDSQNYNSSEWDNMFTGTAGIKFGLGGKQEFTPAELMDYNLINDLNGLINKLRAENEQLSKRPVSCPECPEVVPVIEENVYVPNVVFFRINSSKIDKGQQISIYNTAEYMKSNPDSKVKVVAYADKRTGSALYNLSLSEKRAKAVANSLTNDYGIDSNRVSVEWKGDTEQPYAENDWNRVAIFFAE